MAESSRSNKVLPESLPLLIENGSVPPGESLSSFLDNWKEDGGLPEPLIGRSIKHLLQALEQVKRDRNFGELIVETDNIQFNAGDGEHFPVVKILKRIGYGGGEEWPELGLFGLGIVALKMAFGPIAWNAAFKDDGGIEDPQRMVNVGKNFKMIWVEKMKGKTGQIAIGTDGPGLLCDKEESEARYAQLKKENQKWKSMLSWLFGKQQEDGAGKTLSAGFVACVAKLLERDRDLEANPIRLLQADNFLKSL